MESQSQGGSTAISMMSGYELMESAGKLWIEAFNRLIPDAGEYFDKGDVRGVNVVGAWQQWYEDAFNKRKLRAPDLQVLATSCLEQQKRCSELCLAWCRCIVKTFRAVGNGTQNGDHPAQIMRACVEFSEEYVRYCADFLAVQSKFLSDHAESFPIPAKSGAEKAKPVRV